MVIVTSMALWPAISWTMCGATPLVEQQVTHVWAQVVEPRPRLGLSLPRADSSYGPGRAVPWDKRGALSLTCPGNSDTAQKAL